jgi:predicted nuclease of predicted toxin-antitoxin system
MKFWLNANLAPKIATWLCQEFNIDCVALLDLKEESLSDEEIFARARIANAVVITKDYDFVNLVTARGAPPQVIILSIGNCTNKVLIEILRKNFGEALKFIHDGQAIVELIRKD